MKRSAFLGIIPLLFFVLQGAGAQPATETSTPVASETTLTEMLAAVAKDPENVEIAISCAALLAQAGRKEEALEQYGRVLNNLDPVNSIALREFRRLCFTGDFPRTLAPENLPFMNMNYGLHECCPKDAGSREYIAYTLGVMFPEPLRSGGLAPTVTLPTGHSSTYNRLARGFIQAPGGSTLNTCWRVAWPSATLSKTSADYSPLAARVLHTLLRGNLYIRANLGRNIAPVTTPELNLYLTEDGPGGAEQRDNQIFLYAVNEVREPVEWIREVNHELGHLMLPQITGFGDNEPSASGVVGECLLGQWLAAEAGTLSGAGWPSPAASAMINDLWGGERVGLAGWLKADCRGLMDNWLKSEPEIFTGLDDVQKFTGFMLWLQAAHGTTLLKTMFSQAGNGTSAHYMTAYRQWVVEQLRAGKLSVDAGALTLAGSSLQTPPVEGAIQREQVVLATSDMIKMRLWLPAGQWQIKTRWETAPVERWSLQAGTGDWQVASAGCVKLSTPQAGWQDYKIRLEEQQRARLLAVEILPATS